MSTSRDPRTNDNPSTYFVQDRKNKKELTRLTVQARLMTAAMGGVLSEQTDPTVFHRVLDIGCGPGGWIIDAAQTYPTMSLVGIDISQRMIDYACAQAKTHHVDDQVEFRVMDALRTLEFSAASFDLVNLRSGVSYIRTWDWLNVLSELLRVTRPGGVVRITDVELSPQGTSPALKQLWEMVVCAFFRAGNLFTQERRGLIDHLPRLLDQYGCDQVQTKAYTIEYQAGKPETEAYCEDTMLGFQTARPFIQKWACAGKDYDAVYQQALNEIRQPDFIAALNILTVWGNKPDQNHDSSSHHWPSSLGQGLTIENIHCCNGESAPALSSVLRL